MGVDGPGPRIPGPRAERVCVDRRNEAVHGRRSDAPLRGRDAGAETTAIGVSKTALKTPSKSRPQNGPSHMEKINSFSRSDFQPDTYKYSHPGWADGMSTRNTTQVPSCVF